jgi:hypothetical protein
MLALAKVSIRNAIAHYRGDDQQQEIDQILTLARHTLNQVQLEELEKYARSF